MRERAGEVVRRGVWRVWDKESRREGIEGAVFVGSFFVGSVVGVGVEAVVVVDVEAVVVFGKEIVDSQRNIESESRIIAWIGREKEEFRGLKR